MTKSPYPIKRTTPLPDGVYEVRGGWSHSRDRGCVWADRIGCETDYRFTLDADKCRLNDD